MVKIMQFLQNVENFAHVKQQLIASGILDKTNEALIKMAPEAVDPAILNRGSLSRRRYTRSALLLLKNELYSTQPPSCLQVSEIKCFPIWKLSETTKNRTVQTPNEESVFPTSILQQKSKTSHNEHAVQENLVSQSGSERSAQSIPIWEHNANMCTEGILSNIANACPDQRYFGYNNLAGANNKCNYTKNINLNNKYYVDNKKSGNNENNPYSIRPTVFGMIAQNANTDKDDKAESCKRTRTEDCKWGSKKSVLNPDPSELWELGKPSDDAFSAKFPPHPVYNNNNNQNKKVQERSSIIRHTNVPEDVEINMVNNINSPPPARSTPTKFGKKIIDDNKKSKMDYNFDEILKLDTLNDIFEGGSNSKEIGESRFSQWFKPTSPNNHRRPSDINPQTHRQPYVPPSVPADRAPNQHDALLQFLQQYKFGAMPPPANIFQLNQLALQPLPLLIAYRNLVANAIQSSVLQTVEQIESLMKKQVNGINNGGRKILGGMEHRAPNYVNREPTNRMSNNNNNNRMPLKEPNRDAFLKMLKQMNNRSGSNTFDNNMIPNSAQFQQEQQQRRHELFLHQQAQRLHSQQNSKAMSREHAWKQVLFGQNNTQMQHTPWMQRHMQTNRRHNYDNNTKRRDTYYSM